MHTVIIAGTRKRASGGCDGNDFRWLAGLPDRLATIMVVPHRATQINKQRTGVLNVIASKYREMSLRIASTHSLIGRERDSRRLPG